MTKTEIARRIIKQFKHIRNYDLGTMVNETEKFMKTGVPPTDGSESLRFFNDAGIEERDLLEPWK